MLPQLCIIAISLAVVVFGGQKVCPQYTYSGPGANLCYKFISDAPMSQEDAELRCQYYGYRLPEPESSQDLLELGNYLYTMYDYGDYTDTQGPGYWMGIKRNRVAPFETPGFQYIRTNSNNFRRLSNNANINPNMWRESQPGDTLDHRDERCVAMKDVLVTALDDFVCDGSGPQSKHHAVCVTDALSDSPLSF